MCSAVCRLKQLMCVLCCLFSDGDEIDSPGSTPTSHLSGNTPLSSNPANLSISNLQTCKHLLTELSGAGQNNQEITTKGNYTLSQNFLLDALNNILFLNIWKCLFWTLEHLARRIRFLIVSVEDCCAACKSSQTQRSLLNHLSLSVCPSHLNICHVLIWLSKYIPSKFLVDLKLIPKIQTDPCSLRCSENPVLWLQHSLRAEMLKAAESRVTVDMSTRN